MTETEQKEGKKEMVVEAKVVYFPLICKGRICVTRVKE